MTSRARARREYACGACGHRTPRWVGKCPACGAWDQLEAAAADSSVVAISTASEPESIGRSEDPDPGRVPTGVGELDRVLGGGLVEGGVVLLGGEPGVGKSTLALQALAGVAASGRALLVSGEETVAQVRARAARLECDASAVEVIPEPHLEGAVAAIGLHRPAACVIDSVQTIVSDEIDGGAGAVGQVRHVASELVRAAKATGCALIVVGQITKDGAIAGPRALEHLVDAVLWFEGDDVRAERILRCSKNRFGTTEEAGVFEMRADGLRAASDEALSAGVSDGLDRPGACAFPAVLGSRVRVIEVEALVARTSIVPPRRVAVGIDRSRLAQVVAVLSRHAGLALGDHDVFVSASGGAKLTDPAADLAVALSIVSAHRGAPLAGPVAAFGELGLTGAVRPVAHSSRRLSAVATTGIGQAIGPRGLTAPRTTGETPVARLQGVSTIEDALETAFAQSANPNRE
jgi:DNA repair protein RadA/Sms